MNNEIKTTELRVGNLLNYCGQEVYVLSILRDDYVELGYFKDSVGFIRSLNDIDLNPIQLTEELLLKCLFISSEHKMSNANVLYNEGYYILTNDYIEYSLCVKGLPPATRYIAKCKYLHELQNLIFALDKREVNLKNI